MNKTDFLVVGAGIVGLTIAKELKRRYPKSCIVVLEKEPKPGMHSSGRHSGVMHSGVYYPPGSLKAKVCGQGAKEMAEYCQKYQLPMVRRGKVLVTTNKADGPQLELLTERAKIHGIKAELVDEQGLRHLEPEARSVTGKALWISSTTVGSAKAVMCNIAKEIDEAGIAIQYKTWLVDVDVSAKEVQLQDGTRLAYGHVINCAGLYADKVAHLFNIGKRYVLLPFKGIYWKLDSASDLKIRHLIYPVPDLRVPFLGVHTTTTTDGTTYLGPTAVPAFGRENYRGIEGVTPSGLSRILWLLTKQFIAGKDGFRRLAWQEGRRCFKPWFAQAAQAILPRLKPEHLLSSSKVGIRAQMLDTQSGKLVTDFLVESGSNSTHILNAISPAWTSAFPFARHICDEFIKRR